jgi:hypothetical protein
MQPHVVLVAAPGRQVPTGDTASWKCGLETSTLLFVQLYCDVMHHFLSSRALLQEHCVDAGSRLWCDCLRGPVDCKLNIAAALCILSMPDSSSRTHLFLGPQEMLVSWRAA